MDAIREFLKGKKTYLVSVAAILGLVVAWSTGEVTTGEAVDRGIALILVMTGRAALD